MSNTAHAEVFKMRHYNSHLSGVECIDIAEHLGFNLGNAFKYIYRADHKETRLKDIKKAHYYVFRSLNFPLKHDRGSSSESLLKLMEQVIANEPDGELANYYAYVFSARFALSKDTREHSAKEALRFLDELLSKEETKTAQAAI